MNNDKPTMLRKIISVNIITVDEHNHKRDWTKKDIDIDSIKFKSSFKEQDKPKKETEPKPDLTPKKETKPKKSKK